MTVKVFGYPTVISSNFYDFNYLAHFRTPQISSKELRYTQYLQLSPWCLEMCSAFTPSICHQTIDKSTKGGHGHHFDKKLSFINRVEICLRKGI